MYILYSLKFDKLYIGYTSSLVQRIESHIIKSTKDWTSSYRPWVLIHLEFFETKSEATAREKFYVSVKGRELIRKEIFLYFIEIIKGSYPPEADIGSSR